MLRKSQVEKIRKAEQERDAPTSDPKAAARARAVLDAALRNASREEIAEANPF
ncbi:hypothetical protein [Nonomuraea helvata]|uniref:Uncharacterized protein n=1 Tax=Nonomuraea helvata TaxID=37484 RepID=A0ABV5S5Z1_9ACTN